MENPDDMGSKFHSSEHEEEIGSQISDLGNRKRDADVESDDGGGKRLSGTTDGKDATEQEGTSLSMTAEDGKQKVLFVCLGNICRSPTAEAMFTAVVKRAGVEDQFEIDSCGTGGGSSNWYLPDGFSYHEGESADRRMQAAAVKRDVHLTSRSRPLKPEDLDYFDHIIGMDSSNMRAIWEAADYWGKSKQGQEKTSLMTKYCKTNKVNSVPDPYYGGPQGFENVLDLLDDACSGLLEDLLENKK
eukprot:CAMPEP_0117753996 /NCGR_PEP_ID=MMETSP0947-20121206/12571_1 /TAXON_ID=44440 /ORGANISM="Chattonella subsalsa, Strain CCMP2191" /LENGTH=243 /DNA_ID=CAMNT_0005573011 /DNA_START=264 /DNA_END=995 /DNA_ORIENTATION=-